MVVVPYHFCIQALVSCGLYFFFCNCCSDADFDIKDGTGAVAPVSGEQGGGDSEIRATSPGANTIMLNTTIQTPLGTNAANITDIQPSETQEGKYMYYFS